MKKDRFHTPSVTGSLRTHSGFASPVGWRPLWRRALVLLPAMALAAATGLLGPLRLDAPRPAAEMTLTSAPDGPGAAVPAFGSQIPGDHQIPGASQPPEGNALPGFFRPRTRITPEQAEMLRLINAERALAGASPLVIDAGVLRLSQQKAEDMVAGNYFSHVSPTLGSAFDMLRRAEIPFRIAAENLAANHSVAAAHTALMASSGHRRNILDPRFQSIGIGVAPGGRAGLVVAQVFVGN